jgi:hypothetical protein
MTKEPTEEQLVAWNEKTHRVSSAHTMLSWEACEMIAWSNFFKKEKQDEV